MILGLLRSPFRRRAFTRRTQNPPSSLWQLTRSMTPETCSVAGRRSGIAAVMSGDSFCHGWMGLGIIHRETDLWGFG
jgi:hypothetical protein